MSHLLEQLEGRERRAECEKHETPWILPVSGPLSSADIAALRASHQRLKEALTRLLTQFPTDTDMLAAGWENSEVNAACDAYDHAREALRSAP